MIRNVLLNKLYLRLLPVFQLVDFIKCLLAQVYARARRKVLGKRIAYEIVSDLEGLLCVITGASSEIGLECVKRLLNRNCHVVIVDGLDLNRNSLESQLTNDLRGFRRELWELHHVDLDSLESIYKFASEFKASNRTIDVLINYSDAFLTPIKIRNENSEKRIAANYLGHCLLTLNLLPCLKPSSDFRRDLNFKSRIVNVTSTSHHWIDRSKLDQLVSNDKFSQNLSYSLSKLLTITFSFYLSNEILPKLDKSKDVQIANVHPGITITSLLNSKSNRFFNFIRKFIYNLLLFTPKNAVDHILHGAFSTELNYRQNIYLEFFEFSKLPETYMDVQFQKKVFNQTVDLLRDYLEKDEFITRL